MLKSKTKSRRNSIVSLTLVLALCSVGMTKAQAMVPTNTTQEDDGDDDYRGRIAFVSNRGGNSDIYVMRPDGSDVVNLTNHPASDLLPVWSFDGSKLVFQSTRDGNAEIYVMDDDGSNVVRVTFHPAFDTSPSWTPEGTIVFSSIRSGRFELYEMNVDGSDVRHIDVGLDGQLLFPRVSAQGHRLAFNQTNFFDSGAVWVAQRDGGQPRQLTPDSLVAAFPSWSPHGNRLAFSNNVCPVCEDEPGRQSDSATHRIGRRCQLSFSKMVAQRVADCL